MKIWDVRSGDLVSELSQDADSRIHHLAVHPDGKYAATAVGGNDAVLWNLETGKAERTFSGHGEWVYVIEFSPDGRYLLTGSQDSTAILWDVSTGEMLHKFKGHQRPYQ